jgi:nucleotide-binding universal stress UspA family protein
VKRDDSFVNLRSILSPVDFSEPSSIALRWAGALAARFRSRLTVVSVVDSLLAEAARVRLGQDLAKQETEPALREFVAKALSDATAAPVQPDFRTAVGDVATSILQAAEAESADLIVMGTQGLGGIRKWLLGSTTERVLRRTKTPVLAVPFVDDSQPVPDAGVVSHVLAATDFSAASVGAAKLAAELARVLSAKLTLTHVVEPLAAPPQLIPLVEESDEARVGAARKELHALAGKICGGRCDEVVAVGRPADMVGSIAEDRAAQLIVMGLASEQGAFSPRPGSIAYRVLSSTAVPVLVVPTS